MVEDNRLEHNEERQRVIKKWEESGLLSGLHTTGNESHLEMFFQAAKNKKINKLPDVRPMNISPEPIKNLSMITDSEKAYIIKIKDELKRMAMMEPNVFDKESNTSFFWDAIELIESMARRLEIAPYSYQICSREDFKHNFYTAKCDKCGWYGSSNLLEGGGQIADTGDYSDSYCPVCGNADLDEL